jgi:hypothetical protein
VSPLRWNPGVGASFALSFLIVGVAAVFLHPSLDGTSKAAARPSDRGEPSGTRVSAREPESESRAGREQGRSRASEAPAAPRRVEPADAPGTASLADELPSSGPGVVARYRSVARRLPPGRRPGSPFTDVGQGESLADVALRVYGSSDATEPLWMANRDRVDRPDATLPAGTVLRTP